MLKPMLTLGLGAYLTAAAVAQPCTPEWSRKFFAGDAQGEVTSIVAYDDGTGPALYVGGSSDFTPGGSPDAPFGLARWDGHAWTHVGDICVDGVTAQAVFDDGSGPALYVAGELALGDGTPTNGIARWDGTVWSEVGGDVEGSILTMATHNDGTGPALYVGGQFLYAGGVPVKHVAKWNGTQWAAVGAGFSGAVHVDALAVHDEGTGPALYAGWRDGRWNAWAARVSRWNGTAWTTIGETSGQRVSINALRTWNNGQITKLYAGGWFDSINDVSAQGIAAWDGSSWAPVGNATSVPVKGLAAIDSGANAGLFAAYPMGVRRWTGQEWTNVGECFWNEASPTCDVVNTLSAVDLGQGTLLFLGGEFEGTRYETIRRIACWDGVAWRPATGPWMPGVGSGLNGGITALRTCDPDGQGPAAVQLCAAGVFSVAGGVEVAGAACWDGRSWTPLGDAPEYITALAEYDDGRGKALYAIGAFSAGSSMSFGGVAKWDGQHWTSMESTLVDAFEIEDLQALAVFDDGRGPALYVGGAFERKSDGVGALIVRWDGSAWDVAATGLCSWPGVFSLMTFDDGTGPALYTLGYFDAIDGVPANGIARFDGVSWSAVGTGFQAGWFALGTYDTGDGAVLVAPGSVQSDGDAFGVAQWNGLSWSILGDGSPLGTITAFATLDAGDGPALYATGDIAGSEEFAIARWDGAQWTILGRDVGLQLAVFDDDDDGPTPPALYAGGESGVIEGTASCNIARWGCKPAQRGDLNCDGQTDVRDVNPFVLALINPATYDIQNPACERLYADCDDDGVVNFADINPFIELLLP